MKWSWPAAEIAYTFKNNSKTQASVGKTETKQPHTTTAENGGEKKWEKQNRSK